MSTTRQGSSENNFTFQLEFVATHIAKLIKMAKDRGLSTLEVTADAETEWVKFHESLSGRNLRAWRDCTPSYFNEEGKADERIIRNGPIGMSAVEFDKFLTKWRETGNYEGLELK
jgi:hypothetical protein